VTASTKGAIPRAPADVDVLLDPPEAPYRTVALIRSRDRSLGRNLNALMAEVRAEAARLGADAVIVSLSDSGESGGTAISTDGKVVFVSGSRELRVIGRAIIFADPVEARH
jgi:hypothetical protein